MKKLIIYSTWDYYNDEEKLRYQNDCRDIYGDPEFTVSDEDWGDVIYDMLCIERDNLNVQVDGVIIAFADLGCWNGRRQGYKIIGDKVSDILRTGCDDGEWYGDGWNICARLSHHDGSNYVTYRVADSMRDAERIADLIYSEEIDFAGFRKRTRSLYPYVAKVYGWPLYKVFAKENVKQDKTA